MGYYSSSMLVGIVVMMVVVVQTAHGDTMLSSEERQQIINEAIAEARASAAVKDIDNKVFSVIANIENSRTSSSSYILRHFKKAPEEAILIGSAQLLYEDIVDRAEKKLAKKGESAETSVAGMRRSDSLITQEELAEMWTESGCKEIRIRPKCNPRSPFRTIDGTCNNLGKPFLGSAGINLRRLLRSSYEDGLGSLRGTRQIQRGRPFRSPFPSPRLISSRVVKDVAREEPFSHFVMQWGQFIDHDMDLSPEAKGECREGECTDTRVCKPIRVKKTDKDFGVGTSNKGQCIPFHRSMPGCSLSSPTRATPRQQINAITSFIDGSQVYGSSKELNLALRVGKGGLLKSGASPKTQKESLPRTDKSTLKFVACPGGDCFLCGDTRCNEQTALIIMHTIWLREHNRCARALSSLNMMDNDERIFQDCRKIVGALIQQITYTEYLPKLFGSQFKKFVGVYKRYRPKVNPTIPNSFSTAAYRYGHSLVRPSLSRLGPGYTIQKPLNLVDAFFNPDQYAASGGTDSIVRGLLTKNSLKSDEFISKVLTTQLFETPSSHGLDLAALNIQRGRDHGLPSYKKYKKFCRKTFRVSSRFNSHKTRRQFRKLYGKRGPIDLFVGGLAERRLRGGSVLGATFACIFGITFQGLRDGDRFYYENPGVFTPMQLMAIKKRTFSHVLCENLDNLQTIQKDAFLIGNKGTRVTCKSLSPAFNYGPWRRGGDVETMEEMESNGKEEEEEEEEMITDQYLPKYDEDEVSEEEFDMDLDDEAEEEDFGTDFDDEVEEEDFDTDLEDEVDEEGVDEDLEEGEEEFNDAADFGGQVDVSSEEVNEIEMALEAGREKVDKIVKSLEDSLSKVRGRGVPQ